jgi:GNAT superfamily N-acetyltransferase
MGNCLVTQYQVHARNAAAMWETLSKGHGALLVGTEEVRIVVPSPYHALRAIVLDPVMNRTGTIAAIVETMTGESGVSRRIVEDASGELDLSCHDMAVRFQLTVMARRPGGLATSHARSAQVLVVPVLDRATLVDAEQILMAIFPPPTTTESLRGRIQPPRVLDIPEWRVWLAYHAGVPAGAAYTYHDGASLGVYQVATLPEHRRQGVGRAIMAAILNAYPDELMTLTATDQGRPLYEALGFEACSRAIWWWPSHTGDDSGQGLR